jgi:DNA-binding NtrC family response regulator
VSSEEVDPVVARHALRTIEEGFLGESRAAVSVREQVADFLARHSTEDPPPPILLSGENGVGKSLLARLIHQAGPRRDRPYVTLPCAAIPESSLSTYLLGREWKVPGTDVRTDQAGLFHATHGGTMFLDDVGLLPPELHRTIVKVLEHRSFRRVGGAQDELADVWIIAGTSEHLRERADSHRRYREAFDLHEPFPIEELVQRVAQLDLVIPPLRDRSEDIVPLAEHSLARVCADNHLQPKSFAPDARGAMQAYWWLGNVRQVNVLIERVALCYPESDVISAAMLALPGYSPESDLPATGA